MAHKFLSAIVTQSAQSALREIIHSVEFQNIHPSSILVQYVFTQDAEVSGITGTSLNGRIPAPQVVVISNVAIVLQYKVKPFALAHSRVQDQ
jgi:hypothetical protein